MFLQKSPVRVLWIIGVGLVLFLGLVMDNRRKTETLHISAAVSLKEALGDIGRAFQSRGFHGKFLFNFGSSGALQNQIEQGIPCDLFISASEAPMDRLERKGLLLKRTRRHVAGNELVLVVPKRLVRIVKGFPDLTREQVRKVAVGAPESVPAGQYAMQVFNFYAIREPLKRKMVFGTNVRAVLSYVETGNADAGVVYRTDALSSGKVAVVASASAASHDPIVYPAAVTADSGQSRTAKDFLEFLSGPEARAVFRKYGFGIEK